MAYRMPYVMSVLLCLYLIFYTCTNIARIKCILIDQPFATYQSPPARSSLSFLSIGLIVSYRTAVMIK
jgi:hypothetical protein